MSASIDGDYVWASICLLGNCIAFPTGFSLHMLHSKLMTYEGSVHIRIAVVIYLHVEGRHVHAYSLVFQVAIVVH